VLVTDGEDLEGDPVVAARAAAADGIRVDVVQIGGRAAEIIPDVGPDGRVLGPRRDESGKPLTTQLTAAGEAQLEAIAREGTGTLIRSERGQTGIDKITQSLSRSMKEELSERVETVYGEAYATPLAIAAALLVLEALLLEAPARRRKKEAAKTKTQAEGGARVAA
jgi:Ca-activated chloride channel homolog